MAYCEVCSAPLPYVPGGQTVQRWCRKPAPCRKIGRARDRANDKNRDKLCVAVSTTDDSSSNVTRIIPPTKVNMEKVATLAAIAALSVEPRRRR